MYSSLYYAFTGILFRQYDDVLKRNRQLSMAIFKQFGYGDSTTMEARIQIEVMKLIKLACEKNGEPWNMLAAVQTATLNFIYSQAFNERYELGTPMADRIVADLQQFNESYDLIYDDYSFVKYLPHYKRKLKAYQASRAEKIKFFRDRIRECQKRDDGDDNFVREFIKKIGTSYNEEELIFILRDFFFAGMETTGYQTCWVLIFLGNNPDIQARVQRDLDSVVPMDRLPSLSDEAKLPYLKAVILEVMRVRTIIPLPIARLTTCETELCGYKLPAGVPV